MNTGLEGKIAMVSSAGKGIGKAVALALAAEGAVPPQMGLFQQPARTDHRQGDSHEAQPS